MKKITTILLLSSSLLMIIVLTSWSSVKTKVSSNSTLTSLPEEYSGRVFVKFKDGRICLYQSLKLVKGAFTSPHLLADNKLRINPSEILAYQNEDHYAVSQLLIEDGKKSTISIETLPGFAVRLIEGKLNLYCKKYYNGNSAVDEYFVQLGKDGKILSYSPELLKTLLADDSETLSYFENSLKNKRDLTLLSQTALLYNKTLLLNESMALTNK
jgi:hypothetical protein